MRFSLFSLVLSTAVFLVTALTAYPEQDTLVEELKAGGRVLMIRHAYAPGTGDPPNFRIGDCSTQRNLNEEGRAQARAIGEWLRDRGIVRARVFSSQWCRCMETAELMNLGPVTELPPLNSFFSRPQDREQNLNALESFFSDQPTDGELIVLVTHFVTISAVTGEGVSSGEGVLLRLGENASHEAIGRLDFGL